MSDEHSTRKHNRRESSRAWYQANKEREKARMRLLYQTDAAYRESCLLGASKRRRERRKWLDDVLVESGCVRCGERDRRCLQFHHRDRSQKDRAVTCLMSTSLARCRAEIDKCDILCANCHAKADVQIEAAIPRPSKGRGHAAAQALLARVKELSGCSRCGESDVVCLHFHHEDADFKNANVAASVTKSLDLIVTELLKCAVLCANCHARLHADERRLAPAAKKRNRPR